ncbi:MAG: ABC transporter substrate-binding protein [Rhizobiaceae bacterium]|nr:ABC transporter substrate-binding protein [Rhizobiaceae bacterium]
MRNKILLSALALFCTSALAVQTHAEDGVTDTEVTIGSYLPLQSPLAAAATQYRDGLKAYFDWVNDNGGVNGRKINWIVENDSYNPQQSVAVVKKLVDRDGVLAIVGTLGTSNNLATLAFLRQRGVPLIGPMGSGPELGSPTDEVVFPIAPLGTLHGTSLTEFADKDLKAKTIAIFYQDDQLGEEISKGVEDYVAKSDIKIVARAAYLPSDVDVSVQALTLKEANPDAVILASIPKHGALFMVEAAKLGWKPHFLSTEVMADKVVKDLAGAAVDGLYVNLYAALEMMESKEVAEATKMIEKYTPETPPGYWSFVGMSGAKIFVEGLKKAGADLTRKSLADTLNSMGKVETGLIPPVTYQAGQRFGPTTVGYAQWRNGQVEIVRPW